MITLITLITIFYIIPLLIGRRWVRILYSEKGWMGQHGLDIMILDVFFVITPLVNLSFYLIVMIDNPYQEKYRKKRFVNLKRKIIEFVFGKTN